MVVNKEIIKHIPKLSCFGLDFSVFSKNDLEQYSKFIIMENRHAVFYGYSLGTIPLFKKYESLYFYCNSADLLVIDGEQMYWMLKLFKHKVSYKISIPNLVNALLKIADSNNYSVMMLGANERKLRLAEKNVLKKYSNINLIRGINGFFNREKAHDIMDEIKSKKPNILLIGLPSPEKEQLSIKFRERSVANVIIPCGGMIDVLSGQVNQSPKIIKSMGLATPYRILQEPRKLLGLNVWLTYEILFKIIPVMVYKYILKKKEYNIINLYRS